MASRTTRGPAPTPAPNALQPPPSAPGPDFDLSFLPATDNLPTGTPGIDELGVAHSMYPAAVEGAPYIAQPPFYSVMIPNPRLAENRVPMNADKRKFEAESPEDTTENPGKKLRVLAKNRESARESRRRKKEYVKTLEARVAELEGELEAARSTSSHFSRGQVLSARAKLMESLRPLVKQGATDDQLMPVTEEFMKLNSTMTIPSIDYHIQKIMELLQPYPQTKFLHWSLSQGENFYREDSNGNYNGVFALLHKAIGFSPAQRDQLKAMRELARPQLQGMQMLVAHIRKLGETVHMQLQSNDNLIQQLRSICSATQIAKFLLWAEQNEACMQVVETIWNDSASNITPEPLIETPALPPIQSPSSDSQSSSIALPDLSRK